MVGTAWAFSNFFQDLKLAYRFGVGIILVGLVAAAAFVTWTAIEGNPAATWREITLQWATTGLVAPIARWRMI